MKIPEITKIVNDARDSLPLLYQNVDVPDKEAPKFKITLNSKFNSKHNSFPYYKRISRLLILDDE